MSAPFRDMRLPGAFCVTLPQADDFDFWRDQARALVQSDVPPDRVAWAEPGGSGDLFSGGRRRMRLNIEFSVMTATGTGCVHAAFAFATQMGSRCV